jgi:hypothetical protein
MKKLLVLLLGLSVAAYAIVPYTVTQVGGEGYSLKTKSGIVLHINQTDVLNNKRLTEGEKVYGIFLPAAMDESHFVGVIN